MIAAEGYYNNQDYLPIVDSDHGIRCQQSKRRTRIDHRGAQYVPAAIGMASRRHSPPLRSKSHTLTAGATTGVGTTAPPGFTLTTMSAKALACSCGS